MAASNAFCFLAVMRKNSGQQIYTRVKSPIRDRLTDLGVGLSSHDTTSPVPLGLLILLEVALLDSGDEFGKIAFILTTDFSQGKNGSGLVKECQQWKSQGESTYQLLTFL